MSDPMTPLERIRALAAVDAAAAAGSTASGGATGTGSDLGSHVAISDSLTSIGLNNNPTSIGMNNNNNRSLRRNRFSISGRKPSFSWLSSTSSINSTAPVKGQLKIQLIQKKLLTLYFFSQFLYTIQRCNISFFYVTKILEITNFFSFPALPKLIFFLFN